MNAHAPVASAPIHTTCPYCGVGCGVVATPGAERQLVVRGDEHHPANQGRLCSKGSALGQTVGLEGRLLQPKLAGQAVSWEQALDHVAGRFNQIIEQHGRDAIAFYVSGQLLTEDYYVANKLIKGFIGNAHIDSNSRLCMSSAVAGYKRAFGSDTVPTVYEDLEQCDVLVLIGSNTAWCHPVLFQRIQAAKQKRAAEGQPLHVVVVDPRHTDTCAIADLHLPLKPGTDTTLFNGLLAFLHQQGHTNERFAIYTDGQTQALASAQQSAGSVEQVAASCDLAVADVLAFYRLFAAHERCVSFYSQGVNQSSAGTDKANSIINVHLLTGRIGGVGMGPFSITGQPNAMGGREVGALSNLLAAHLNNTDTDRDLLRRFWNAPHLAEQEGLKAVDLFRAVKQGNIKAIWIMATNPVVSMPDASLVREALEACDCVVVSDCIAHTDTTAVADVLFPAQGWSEKDGTVTNSERRISRQRRLFEPAGEARPDWWIISQVAQRMGFADAFSYDHPYQIFNEHSRLSGFENNGQRTFDISGAAVADAEAYQAMQPFQWPWRKGDAGGPGPVKRFFAEGGFATPSGKAQLLPINPRPVQHSVDPDYPLALNTGRVRDQWHTMTRTGLAPRLNRHCPEPILEMHPQDAASVGVEPGHFACVQSRWGQWQGRVALNPGLRPGEVFVPMHWSQATGSSGSIGQVINPAVDPVSGQPELKHTPVAVTPVAMRHFGFLLSRRPLNALNASYWVRVQDEAHYRYILAHAGEVDWQSWLLETAAVAEPDQLLEYRDAASGEYRFGVIEDGQLQQCLWVSSSPTLPSDAWLAERFQDATLSTANRYALLAGRAPGVDLNTGRTVCACFGVGENTLLQAIKSQGLASVAAIGDCLQAGTNCGSCIPELHALLKGTSD